MCALKNEPGPDSVHHVSAGTEKKNIAGRTIDIQFISFKPDAAVLRLPFKEHAAYCVDETRTDRVESEQEMFAIQLACFAVILVQDVLVVPAEGSSIANLDETGNLIV